MTRKLDKLQEDAENLKDIGLLKSEPSALVVKYQWLIQYLVNGYVNRGFLTLEEQADMVQEVTARLLDGGVQRMREKYDKRTLVRTYFGVIVRSLISDQLKKKRSQKAQLVETQEELPEVQLAETNAGPNELLVSEEVRRLETALKLVPRIAGKLKFCMRVWVRWPLSRPIVLEYHPEAPATLVKRVVEELQQYATREDKEVYPTVVLVVNDAEGKATNPDSLRRWVRRKADWLIAVLTGDPPRANYSDESLQLLLQTWFERLQQREHKNDT